MRSKRVRSLGVAALVAAAPLVVAACGESESAGSEGGAAASTTSICAAYSDAPSVKDIPALIAFDELADRGVEIEVKRFADGDQAVQAVVSGKCDIGFNGSFGAILAANEAGASLKAIGVGTANEFSLVGGTSVTDVAQLDGATYGVFSELSYDKAMAQVLAKEHGVEPKYVVARGSDARGPALVAGRIDATGLDAQTIAVLDDQGQADKFNVLMSFNDVLPGLITNTIYTSADFLEANRADLGELITAIDASYAATAGDTAKLKEAGKEKLETWGPVDEKAVDAYVEQELWPASQADALTEQTAQLSAEFYKDAGNIEAIPDVSQVIDTSLAGS